MTRGNNWNHADLANALGKATQQPDGSYKTNCPSHQDKVQSLHVSEGDKGQAVVNCMAGCDQATVWVACLDKMGGAPTTTKTSKPRKSTPQATLPAPSEATLSEINHYEFGAPTHLHEYRDTDGALHFYNCRFEFDTPHEKQGKKTHRPYCYVGNKWAFQAPEKGRRIPYRLDKLLPTGTVIIHEGEKASNAGAELAPEVSHLGWWGGANNATYTDWNAIAGRDVWLIPDNDDPGIKAMESLSDKLRGLGCSVKLCANVGQALSTLGVNAELLKGFDAADALALGWDHERFTEFLDISVLPPADADMGVMQTFTASVAATKEKATINKFIPLGYNNDTYYYLSRSTKQIHALSSSAHKRSSFTSICPQDAFWMSYVPQKKGNPDWDQASSRMMDECQKAGLFDSENIRGRGAWYDRGRSVLHLGNRLIIDGEPVDILTRPGKYIYELAPTLEGPGEVVMSDEEARDILSVSQQFSWEHPISALYLIGWIMLAPICGAIQWRPHVWITGSPGTGKSTIMDRFTTPLLGNMAIVAQGDSTEAGIRQTLKHDALPVILDEAESEGDKGAARRDLIIQMIRQASSDGSARTIKGGATGHATSFHVRSMFMLGSVGVSLKNAADQSRIAILPVLRSTRDWREVEAKIAAITPGTSRRLIARSVAMIPTIRHNTNLLADAIVKVINNQRLADQHGILLAGAVGMMHMRKLTQDEAEAFIEEHRAHILNESRIIESDEWQCLSHILEQPIRMDRTTGSPVTLSVGELIHAAQGYDAVHSMTDSAAALIRHGIKLDTARQVLFIAQSHSQLATLFRGTPWQACWHRPLLRIPEIVKKEIKVRFAGGSPCRAIEVPLSLITGDMTDETESPETIPF